MLPNKRLEQTKRGALVVHSARCVSEHDARGVRGAGGVAQSVVSKESLHHHRARCSSTSNPEPASERLQHVPCLQAKPDSGGGVEAQHRSDPCGQPWLWGVRCLRRRDLAGGSHAPYRRARQRRYAPAQLQRRGVVHSLPFRAHHRPLLDSVRNLPSFERGSPRRLTQWEITIAELLSARAYATGTWGSGTSEAPSNASRRIKASTNGMASRAPTARPCGRLERDQQRLAFGRHQTGLERGTRSAPASLRSPQGRDCPTGRTTRLGSTPPDG